MLKPHVFIIALAIPLLFSCRKTSACKDEELSIKKMPYNGAHLRTDGFYYSNFIDTPITAYADTPVTRSMLLMFYRNGIVNFSGSADSAKMETYVATYLGQQKDCRDCWGLFSVDGSDIQLERWPPAQFTCSPIERSTGKVINDSTFVLSMKIRTRDGHTEQSSNQAITYHFRKFNFKPDSTNNVIK
jgi:hypothetical protein